MNLSIAQLFCITNAHRDIYMEKYFQMRLADYLMHMYNRYGYQKNPDPEIVKAFQDRNKQLEAKVD